MAEYYDMKFDLEAAMEDAAKLRIEREEGKRNFMKEALGSMTGPVN